MEAVKVCCRCKQTKPTAEFHKMKASRAGLRPECKQCHNRDKLTRRSMDPERRRAADRARRARESAETRARRAANREPRRDHYRMLNRRSWLKRAYGMTLEDYDALIATQNGLCAICGGPPPGTGRLVVDHDHSCCAGQRSCGRCVRGALCMHCNRQLGWVEKNLQPILAYLKREKDQ